MDEKKGALFNATNRVLSKIKKGDVIAYATESFSVEFEMDRLKSVENESNFAMGLRVFIDKKVGNSFINNLNDENSLLENAIKSAKLGEIQDFELPSSKNIPEVKLYDENVISFTKEMAIEKGVEIIKKLKKVDKNAKISVNISKAVKTNFLANTNGFSASYSETSFSFYINMTYVHKDGRILSVSEGDSFSRLEIGEIDKMCDSLIEKYTNAKTEVKVKTGYFPVLFSPDALSLLVYPLEIAANGKNLYKKVSILENKLGEKIASEAFSIWDNPLYNFGISSYPFDDEGVIPEKLTIIENGVFKNFIFDLFTASKLNKKSTGHAQRSVSSLPSPSFSNIFIEKGEHSLKDMLSSIDYGIWVFEFLGEGMSNILAGDFSVNIELGYLIEKGKIKGRVKDTMLSGNSFEAIKNISMIENQIHKKGDLYAPSILIDKLSITG